MALSPQSIQAALQAIEQHQRILISPHANVDPDGLSSALACYQMLKAMGKDVTVICPDTKPDSLSFLPGFEKLEQEVKENKDFVVTINLDEGAEIDKLRYTVEDHRVNIIVVPKKGRIRSQQVSLAEGEAKYDLLLIVDTADLALLGSLYTDHVDLFSEVPILNIDHHISNTNFGQLQLIDPTAASATEVLYSWFLQVPSFRDKITPDMATLLLTGLITDTRSFQNPNTTPRSLEVAAELLEKGARQQEIIQHIYKTKPLSTLKIWGRALNHIQVDNAARIVWSAISKEDLAEMDAKATETHGILDELISTIPDADVYVLFTELEEGGLKASMRSTAAVDVSQLAGRTFGGGGHARASGFRMKAFDNFQLAVLECIQKLKDGMQKMREDDEKKEQELSRVAASTPVAKDIPQAGRKVTPPPVQPMEKGIDVVQSVEKKVADDGKQRDIVKDVTK
jgi:nanoRNase/pAp phosphatase (c-di-AMP/oligoRNAs hydrolase)